MGPYEHCVTFYGPDGFVEISSKRGINALSEKHYGDRKVHPLLENPEWGTGFRRLWTPHRMAYIQGENKPTGPSPDDGCPFCTPVRYSPVSSTTV